MRLLTANRSILTTRNVTWRHVPLPPPAPPQQLSPIAEEEGSTAGEGESGEGAPSQSGGRAEEDLDGESDLDVTEVGPMLTAMRKTETAETGAGAGGVAEGDPAASSDYPGSNSTSTSRGDVPTLAGREAHRQKWDGKIPALQGGRTRSQSRQHQMSTDTADALLTHARRTGEEDTDTERVHDLLLEGRLEEEHEGLGEMMEWLEEDGPALERREEAQDPNCPLAMAAEQDHEISTPAPIGKQPSEVESPPLSGVGVERSVYRKGWEEALKSEFDGHTKTCTFSMVDRVPKGRKPVSSKWCFGYKTDTKGKITKLKARLVARGFTQIRDVDYTHSSSPCPSSASVKLILAVASEKGLPLRHFDVAQAYIRASLDEEVYIRLLAGCGEQSKRTAKLERAIYGLKQSGRQWGHLCADTLIADGFEQSKAGPCTFRKVVDEVVVMIVGVYVDDLLVGGSEEDCESLLASLNKKLPTNDLGECTWYDTCGIERDVELGTIKLSQEAYVESLMKRFDVQLISDIPASPGADLGPKQDDESGGDWPVREAIGSLMWLSTMTRPDITNAVRAVARYAHEPTERLWQAIMKILSYLNGTRSLGITYVRGSGMSLSVYADADYASKENDRRSVSGIAATLGGTVVSHTSKTQRLVSLSTSEAEYIAAGEGVKKTLFVRAVLSFIAPETSGASIKVLEDNQGAKVQIESPLSSARSKHIDVRYHFIRDLFRTRKISVEYVASAEQHADILTKALSRANLMYHLKHLMNLAE